MKESSRIGILIFLYNRDELTSGEKNELLDWRMKSSENEKLFFQLTDPKLIRELMQEYYQERDRGFEKLKTRFPWLSEIRLSGSLEEAAKLFAETSVAEEDDQSEDFKVEYADQGLTPVEYWGSTLSRLDDEEEGVRGTAYKMKSFLAIVKPLVDKFWERSRFMRRSIRVAYGLIGFFAALYVANYFMTDHKHENYQAGMVGPDGIRYMLNEYERGKKAGHAHISFGETEKGEPLNIFPDHPEAARDKTYSLETEPGGEFVLQLPDRTRIWMNASSGFKFTANFQQDTIRVAVDGEAYFEISNTTKHHYLITGYDARSMINGNRSTLNRQPSTGNRQPDSVNRQPSTIFAQPSSVLNINTYPGNGVMMATLIRGGTATRDSAAGLAEKGFQLFTGKMALIRNDSLIDLREVDANEILGWKNDELYYKDAPLAVMMPALASWYDVDIEYPVAVPDRKFSLHIPRSEPLSKVLDALRQQGLHITKQGRTLMIWK